MTQLQTILLAHNQNGQDRFEFDRFEFYHKVAHVKKTLQNAKERTIVLWQK